MHVGTAGGPLAERWSLRSLRPQDVAEVRSQMAQRVTKWGYEADTAALVMSELLTNVVRHADGRAVACIQVRGTQLLISVADKCAGEPELLNPDWECDSGRGVFLINSMATMWGSAPVVCGKCVWVLLPLVGLHLCHGCKEPVDEGADGVFAGWITQPGKPADRLVYCQVCSARIVRERTGDDGDSGWGVTARCTTLVAS